MNGWSLLSSLVWAAVALVIAWRAERIVVRWMAMTGKDPANPVDLPPIPNDLEALALQESELHAQESMREVIRERYAKLQDWNLVRHAVGIGEMT